MLKIFQKKFKKKKKRKGYKRKERKVNEGIDSCVKTGHTRVFQMHQLSFVFISSKYLIEPISYLFLLLFIQKKKNFSATLSGLSLWLPQPPSLAWFFFTSFGISFFTLLLVQAWPTSMNKVNIIWLLSCSTEVGWSDQFVMDLL